MNKPPLQFTGVLLAGGSSARMGEDKARIVFGGEALWYKSLRVLSQVCSSTFIAGNRPDLASDDFPYHADRRPGSALAGLHTALSHAPDWITVLPCDLPFPSPALLRRLQDACREGVDAVVPKTRFGREPLIACYNKSALAKIEQRLKAGQSKILDLLDELVVHELDEAELPPGWRRALRNLNTPADLDRLQQPPPAISFIAPSGTGKTTLLTRVISTLSCNGWTVGALKHDAHSFEIDREGKDSWRLAQAGATVTAISAADQTAIIERHERPPEIDLLLAPFAGKVDIVLTEGFKASRLPKIEVYRAALGRPLLSRGERYDPTLVAIAGDPCLKLDVPCFALDETESLATFIEERFLLSDR